ncbi:hypothetical protein [Planktothrix agardhii]|jgi:hypothetical protein|uniref:hypothetical protein n=1 Tax=Planktothrix agardhii TaxID=1160 RepID=UPI001D09B6A4|nr:hypothetical protein [Planktothrix agardhii]MCB8749220.1 hypothetical protein [Planktothrix agardhii 1810]
MGINEECDVLQSMLSQVLNSLAEVQSRAKYLPDYGIYKLRREISDILEICCEEMSRLKNSQKQIELIQAMIGVQSFLPSIIHPTISLANTSADTSIITSIITDLKKNPLAYKTLPWLKMLGDAGELAVWKVLLDVDSEDNLDWSEVQIKPKFESNSGKELNPDFYVSSCHLICDAKAWKPANPELGKKSSVELNVKSLKETAEKYADAKCLNDGGEMRLYFPEDTYNQQKSILDKLESEVQSKFSNVKIKMCPIPGVTYQDLSRQTRFRYTFLKWLGL